MSSNDLDAPSKAASDPPSATFALPTKKHPRGVVLDKDGKPCRSCTSLADFSAFTKSKSAAAATTGTSSSTNLSSSTSSTTTSSGYSTSPPNCPPDVEALGRASWTLLHTLTATYPERASPALAAQTTSFLATFATLYPCWVCGDDFAAYMRRERVRAESRAEFGRWMCDAHNEVNRKLGKREFDCARWEERWGTGGKGC